MKEQHIERVDPLCRFFQTRSEARLQFISLQLDRLQLTAGCCNRRVVWTAHLTRHTFSLFHIDLHAHAWLKSFVWRAHITCHVSSSCAHVFVLTLRDFSTFFSLLSIFSLIILSFLLGHQLHLPRCGGQIPCALQPWHPCRARPSHSFKTPIFAGDLEDSK